MSIRGLGHPVLNFFSIYIRQSGRRGAATKIHIMLRVLVLTAMAASATAFGLAPATPALRSAGKAALPLAGRPRARALGGATKLSALGNLFGLGSPVPHAPVRCAAAGPCRQQRFAAALGGGHMCGDAWRRAPACVRAARTLRSAKG